MGKGQSAKNISVYPLSLLPTSPFFSGVGLFRHLTDALCRRYDVRPFSRTSSFYTSITARSLSERNQRIKDMNVTHLECAACGTQHEARRLHNLCAQCGKPLLVRYDLKRVTSSLTKDSLRTRGADLWRYRE